MNRPDRMNALGGGLPEALNEAWLDFRDDPEVQVMIITGLTAAFVVNRHD